MISILSSLLVTQMNYSVDMDNFDIVGLLPTEIGAMILRYLDGESLLKAAGVSKRWNSLCKGDKKLRQRGRQQLRQMKKRKKEQIYGTVKRSSYVPIDEVAAFSSKIAVANIRRNTQNYVKNENQRMAVRKLRNNILQELAVNVGRSPSKVQKPKSLTSQQKRRLLRH